MVERRESLPLTENINHILWSNLKLNIFILLRWNLKTPHASVSLVRLHETLRD